MAPEERAIAGRVSGAFYVIGGLTLVPLILLGDGFPEDRPALIAVACASFAWGVASLLLIDWDRAPRLLIHLSVIAGLGLIATTVEASGGAESLAAVYLFFVAVFAGYFFPWRVALC